MQQEDAPPDALAAHSPAGEVLKVRVPTHRRQFLIERIAGVAIILCGALPWLSALDDGGRYWRQDRWGLTVAAIVAGGTLLLIARPSRKRRREARERLERLESELRDGAVEGSESRALEARLLRRYLAGRSTVPKEVFAEWAPPDDLLPDCLIFESRHRKSPPIPKGSAVSFELIDLDGDADRYREALTEWAGVAGKDIPRWPPGHEGRGCLILIVAVVVLGLFVGGLQGVWQALTGVRIPRPPRWLGNIIGLLGLGVIASAIESSGVFRRHRWYVGPRTVLVTGRRWWLGRDWQKTFRRGESLLWIDIRRREAGVIGPAGNLRRSINPSDAVLLIHAWRSTAEPPPIDGGSFPV